MKKILLFLVVFSLFVSCKKELAKKPDNLIDKDKMVDIMYDLSVLNAMRSQNSALLDSFKNNSNAYIYKKYKIDSTQFAKSNIYYAADYKGYSTMYEKVKLRLDSDKKRIEAAINIEKKKTLLLENRNKKLEQKKEADSIKKVKIKIKKESDSLKNILLEAKKKNLQKK